MIFIFILKGNCIAFMIRNFIHYTQLCEDEFDTELITDEPDNDNDNGGVAPSSMTCSTEKKCSYPRTCSERGYDHR